MLQSGPDVYPQELLDSMLFGMVDVKDNWVMNPCNYRPNIGLTRLYWINDLESTREEYEQAKEMSAADEWLKGLDKERNLQLQEIEKIEKWESSRPAHLNPEHNEFLKSMPMLSRGSSGKLFISYPSNCQSGHRAVWTTLHSVQWSWKVTRIPTVILTLNSYCTWRRNIHG
jgi:hypothetical protein